MRTLSIMTKQRYSDWIAWMVEEEEMWESGTSEADAIGKLVISMRSRLVDKVTIEEMPQGCVLNQIRKVDNNGEYDVSVVLVSDPFDAVAIIESLIKMVEIQHPTHVHRIVSILENVKNTSHDPKQKSL